jgi:RNA polymerase sigma factor (sigma-70 family)
VIKSVSKREKKTTIYGKCERLTAQEEAEACRLKDLGDKEAFNRLVEAVVPYAVDLARQYSRRNTDSEDMAQIAIIAVIGAIPRFDATKGRLTTFVTSPIIWALLRSRDSYFSAVCVPHWSKRRRMNRCNEFPMSATPTVDSHEKEIDDTEELEERVASIRYAMKEMPEKWRYVLIRRSDGLTLSQIGIELGITKERVRQLEARAIAEVQYRLEVQNIGA